jgi:integrase
MSKDDLLALVGALAGQLGSADASHGAGSPSVPPARGRRNSPGRVQFLTAEELTALFAAVHAAGSERDMALFEVAYHRGLRASEVGLLKIGHLRLAQRRLYVTRLKKSKSGEYPLTEREVKALRAWMRKRGQVAGPLFLSRNRKPISRRRLDQLMKHYGAAAGLPDAKRHFHCLRHTCATQLVEREVDILLVADHLGHCDIRNTQVYAKVSDRRRQQLAERLQDF